ncbi:ATP synthase subunit I [Corticibacter populi]|uniref:ATP synthase subunit I n=1 Tax=Corticibacter populi TaxID=1550736 RepID=A0A3M6QZR4_9BURK|nr:ATP synthase subunit I [Corticibacter populi]RMX08403.1 ATP synthase subunit I [Corticibacter populi]RZS35706.1 ATP synthase protein I [Corticibacter populi]
MVTSDNDRDPWLGDEEQDDEAHPAPLDARQAAAWRSRHRAVSPSRVLLWQCMAGWLAVMLTWSLAESSAAPLSVAYGVLAIVLPAFPFAMAIVRGHSLAALVVWEFVKLMLSVMLLLLAPVVLGEVVWLALLAGVIVTINMYWIAPLWLARSGSVQADLKKS